jgi:hypothetical protein
MGERLGEVPEVPARVDVELLGIQAKGDATLTRRSIRSRARCISPMIAKAETSQKEQIRNVPSLPGMPSSISPVRTSRQSFILNFGSQR